MLYHVPIEPYETRYTADWVQQFEQEFINRGIDFLTVAGKSTSSTVTPGGVLDTAGTHIYKFSQLTKLMSLFQQNKIKDGDTIFFADLWFPGLESLFYVRNMTKIDFKICGIFHAGTYDSADFTYRSGMRNWGKYLEASWFSEIDKIFLATEFHKKLLLDNSMKINGLENKLVVTGLPFYGDELEKKYLSNIKQNILVFPHRMDPEKHPELFDELVEYLKREGVEFFPVKTIVETRSRAEYFELLGKSKVMVSFADQETFGYSTLESMALQNIVVVPDKLSYREIVPEENRYSTYEEAFKKVKDALSENTLPNYNTRIWKKSIGNMLDEIGGF